MVITAGVFSEKLSKKYGANVPMQSERGYHLELIDTNVKLKYPDIIKTLISRPLKLLIKIYINIEINNNFEINILRCELK